MRRKNYWKECSLLLMGMLLGYSSNKIFSSPPPQPVIVTQLILNKDTLVYKDSFEIKKEVIKLTKENLKKELISQNIPQYNIVFHQAMLETGHLTSKLCKNNNNLFGIKQGNRYKSYKTWQDCVVDYRKRISSRYNGGDYYAFLKRIKYAENPEYIKLLKKMA